MSDVYRPLGGIKVGLDEGDKLAPWDTGDPAIDNNIPGGERAQGWLKKNKNRKFDVPYERPDNLEDPIENKSGRGNFDDDVRWELESKLREIEKSGEPFPQFLEWLKDMHENYESIDAQTLKDLTDRYNNAVQKWPEGYKGF